MGTISFTLHQIVTHYITLYPTAFYITFYSKLQHYFSHDVILLTTIWFGGIWCDIVHFYLIQCDIMWYCALPSDAVWYDIVHFNLIQCDMMWYCSLLFDKWNMMWYCQLLSDIVWYDLILCTTIWCNVIWCDILHYHLMHYDMMWYWLCWQDLEEAVPIIEKYHECLGAIGEVGVPYVDITPFFIICCITYWCNLGSLFK